MKKHGKKIIICLLLVVGIVITTFIANTQNEIIETLSKYGSRGSEVRTIQEKLKRWGYYKGNVDGIYGSQTTAAVKSFQRKNGLTVDGIAGTNTLRAMGIYTSSTTSSSSSSH